MNIIVLICLIFNLCSGQFVENIDGRLVKELLCPKNGGVNGEDTFQLMWSYYGMMIDIRNMLRDGNEHVYRYVYNLYNKGGPEVFRTEFNYSLVRERYHWNDEALQDFHKIFHKARKVWNNILWEMSQKDKEKNNS